MKTIIYMNSRKNLLEKEIKELEGKLSEYPSGSLNICKNGERYKYYRQEQTSPGNRTRTYIPSKDHALVESLAQKAFYDNELRNRKNELLATQRYLNARKEIITLSPAYDALLSFSQDEWNKKEYERNPLNPEKLTVKATNDLYVRSKSEAMIAHILDENNIPFRYECALILDEVKLFPDFTILKPNTDKECIWEHFGLIDIPSYRATMFKKLELLLASGYIPGNNLILTYETKDKPLDMNYVENLVKYHFI